MTTNLKHADYKVDTFADNVICLITKVQIERPGVGLWKYSLMIETVPTEKGVDGNGNQACGFAEATMIKAHYEPETVKLPTVEIGGTVLTHLGEYRVDWLQIGDRANYSYITLTKI